MTKIPEIKPCSCGAPGRLRYRMPFNWVECKKKCGNRTGSYCDYYEQHDPDAIREAVKDWNAQKYKRLIDYLK